LLSCRALGRGVEHAMAAWLGRRALAEGRRSVEFACRPTERNQPVLDFIADIGGPASGEAATAWQSPAERLAAVVYSPVELEREAPAPAPSPSHAPKLAARTAWDFAGADSERMQAVAQDLCSVERILHAIDARARGTRGGQVELPRAPAGSLEAALADIWARVLGKSQVGLHDNFFDAGGTSLKAVRVVA